LSAHFLCLHNPSQRRNHHQGRQIPCYQLAVQIALLFDPCTIIFTVADYAAQAVISSILRAAFPDDPIVGEEDASTLRFPNTQVEWSLRERIVKLANDALTSELMIGDSKNWALGPGMEKSDVEILDAIDAGKYEGGPDGRS
jgi:3'-phosphoadenosine 5'-phosphosulfate (PAPS) 3'-phosphatase